MISIVHIYTQWPLQLVQLVQGTSLTRFDKQWLGALRSQRNCNNIQVVRLWHFNNAQIVTKMC